MEMYLTVEPQAQEKLQRYLDEGKDLLLDFDDGVGSLSNVGTCTLASVFRVIAVDKDAEQKDYNKSLDSNIGAFRYKGYSEMYMDPQMKLVVNPTNKMLSLRGSNSGELTGMVNVEDLSAKV
ncbi:hypothetical protein FC65_GL001210 [Ligilactobacillus acidipiscis DSM 15836]|uniref:Core domain-containing protein n=3 Tax=Ligilactobacillus acidipiscis TaxID=89059 RepID=A0A0R2KCZ7_9LACO|nr:hypothetical protein FC65_GL001210 [Ligilactobacillus acidipiscis DSM 15836]KRN84407.1 hypothetical protein IV43_GL001253 [Ligilactobacillus acidipiscis]GAW63742.1 hypothetical protein Lacidipiscis_00925 [Ligilactobacillus acidipiscis]SFV40106.1 hypothetical protein LAC1533_0686 [Ligilactobacillus acidipiscis]